MPKNFPDIWIGRVEKKLTSADSAPWLDGIPEINGDVVTLGEGTDTEKNIIYVPTTDFEPDVLINNDTYPLALQEYTDDTATIALDKYQTKQTSISDDASMGASYDIVTAATGSHTTAILKKKYAKAIHAIAPSAHNAAKTPVLKTTGLDDGAGRKMLTRKDLNALKKAFDDLEIPSEGGRRLVLCPDHINDLLNFDQKFENQYYNYTTGKIANVSGFEIYEYVANPYFNATTGAKKSFGSIPVAGTDFRASVAFYAPNIGKKTGKTKQYFSEAKANPGTQANTLNYRHYFICVPKRAEYIGAIISGVVAG
jgi:hypothetical protein